MKKAYRTIHYYELAIDYYEDGVLTTEESLRQTFAAMINMAKSKQPERYKTFGGKFIFIQDVEIDPVNKILRGKLRSIRTDVKPEIIDMITDTARGLETAENEGIMETSHFVINYSRSRKRPLLAYEFNVVGGRISDLVNYIIKIGNDHNLIRYCHPVPIGRGSLDRILERVGRCSEIQIKVRKDQIQRIKPLDEDTFSALSKLESAFQSEYVTIDLKYDYKERRETKEANSLVERIIFGFKSRPDLSEAFESLKVTAEDSERNNLLDTFDLLVDKQKSRLLVQLIEGYSVIVSADMFAQIDTEITRKKLLDD